MIQGVFEDSGNILITAVSVSELLSEVFKILRYLPSGETEVLGYMYGIKMAEWLHSAWELNTMYWQ